MSNVSHDRVEIPASRSRATPIALCTLLVALSSWPGPVVARVQARAEGSVATGFTNDPSPGTEGDRADGFTEISPSVSLLAGSARAVHQLRYTFAGTFFYRKENREANALNNLLDYIALIEPSDGVRWTTLVNVTQGRQTSAYSPVLGLQPDGNVDFVSGRASEALSWVVSPAYRLTHSLTAGTFIKTAGGGEQADSVNAALDLGVRRVFDGFELGLQGRGGYTAEIRGGAAGTDHIQIGELAAVASATLGRDWTLDAEAGALEASTDAAFSELYIQPTAALTLRFARPGVTASLGAVHTARPNLQVGDTFAVEEVRLAARIPLGRRHRERWFFGLGGGYDLVRQLDIRARRLGEVAHAYLADASLAWDAHPSFTVSLRYLFSGQTDLEGFAAPTAAPGDPLPISQRGFNRHLLQLGITARFPGGRARDALQTRGIGAEQVGEADWKAQLDPTPGQQRPTTPTRSTP